MKAIHFIKGEKTVCGLTPTTNDTKSFVWFNHMRNKCKTCDKNVKK